jgi:flavin reductase (DIM6/NTAB) family NADH-FMN oxidoreductase RutF
MADAVHDGTANRTEAADAAGPDTALDARPGLAVPLGVDPATFRLVLGHFCTGVTVVTAVDNGVPVGTTCQAFTSLSLDPPLVAFCPSQWSVTYPRLRSAGKFCVNVLSEHQEEVARRFSAKDGTDRFHGIGWAPAPSGSPVLHGSVAWVDCTVQAEYDGGDHLIVVGRVRALGSPGGAGPLLFFRGGYRQFSG